MNENWLFWVSIKGLFFFVFFRISIVFDNISATENENENLVSLWYYLQVVNAYDSTLVVLTSVKWLRWYYTYSVEGFKWRMQIYLG